MEGSFYKNYELRIVIKDIRYKSIVCQLKEGKIGIPVFEIPE